MDPGDPDRAQSEDLLQVRPQFTDKADIKCTRELDEKGLFSMFTTIKHYLLLIAVL